MRTSIVNPRGALGTRLLVAGTAAIVCVLALRPTAFEAPTSSPAVVVEAGVRSAAAIASGADVVVQAVPGHADVAAAAVERTGGEVGLHLPIIDGFAARITPSGLEALEALGGGVVRAVSLDRPVAVHHTPSDGQTFDDSSFVETIGADRLHQAGIDGSGVGIAIVDTGVSEVADLTGRVMGGVDLSAEQDGVDRYGHGTFIAGVAAGSGASSGGEHAGVAPGAHVVPVKIAGANGAADVSHVLGAIQWVVSFKDDHAIKVMNLSFGTDSTQSYTIDPMNYAVEKAWDAGIVVVVAAANAGPDPKTVFKPADDPFVVTVGATDSNGTIDRDDDVVTGFSSRGPTRTDGVAKPDLVAPGAHIIGLRAPGSTIDSEHSYARVGGHYFRGSGTSFSAAVASGAAALLAQMRPDWSPDRVKQALFDLAVAGPVGDRNVDGYGALDVRWATHIGVPGMANAGKIASTGGGTVAASRGNLVLELETDPVAGLVKVLNGEYTAQDLLFNWVQYSTTEWTKANWYESDWQKANWYKANWYEADWTKANWYKANWYGAGYE